MGPRTMASPNGAQAPEFSQSVLNQTVDGYPYIAEVRKHYKLDIGELVNNVQQFQAPTSSYPSSSASITPSLPMDCNMNGDHNTVHKVIRDITGQEDHGSGNMLALFGEPENCFFQGVAQNHVYEGRRQCSLPAEPVIQHQSKWMQHEPDSYQQHQQQSMGFLGSSLPMFGNATMNDVFSESQQAVVAVVPVVMAKSKSLDSKMLAGINRNEEIVDKSIERRQKRMIKNRESAARSRARKQAYINELEDKVRKLEDAQMQLKRQMKEKSAATLSRTAMGISLLRDYVIQVFDSYRRVKKYGT